MIGGLKRALDRFRGFGDFALSVPSLDGAFRPNMSIEEAAVLTQIDRPDNLALAGGQIYASSGGRLLRLEASGPVLLEDGAPITAIAGDATGQLAVARSGQAVSLRNDKGPTTTISALAGKGDATALAFRRDGSLVVAVGVEGKPRDQWRRDLLSRGRNGVLWQADANGQVRRLASGLAYPYGVVEAPNGDIILSLSWASAVARLDAAGRLTPVLENLPGYPARLISAAGGGFWLAVFAPRNQLFEFVLNEELYRKRMMAEIEPEFWICPNLEQRDGPLDVMQDGAQKIGGEMKPWAPTFSSGLIVRLDADLLPLFSHHSRANGRRHGITSLVEKGGELLASSWGGQVIFTLPTTEVRA